MWPPDFTLERDGIRLEPLTLAHEAGLRTAAADGELWNLRVTSVPEPEQTRAYIETALKHRVEGSRQPFAVIDIASGNVIGSTSYHDMMESIKRVEIGYTWYAKRLQRSHVNTICKLMLMTHAFETLQCPVVGWRTDIFNFASQRAIEKLGAKRDGVIRHHGLRRDGSVRDTVIYSMLASEWPEKKAKLEARLQTKGFNASGAPDAAITLRKIDADMMLPVLRLKAGARGEEFVASNAVSLAQASVSANAVPRAVYAGETLVGFVMFYDPTIDPALAEKDGGAADTLEIWRFMIDFAAQRSGLGKRMMRAVFDHALARTEFKRVRLSYYPIEGNPSPFYASLGFVETGELDDDEHIMEQSIDSIRARIAATT
jgi:N-acetyltransferase